MIKLTKAPRILTEGTCVEITDGAYAGRVGYVATVTADSGYRTDVHVPLFGRIYVPNAAVREYR